MLQSTPRYLEDVPLFWDHTYLSYLTAKAESLGMSAPFPDSLVKIEELGRDTGEVFLSKYFWQQRERRLANVPFDRSNCCTCEKCKQVSGPNPKQLQGFDDMTSPIEPPKANKIHQQTLEVGMMGPETKQDPTPNTKHPTASKEIPTKHGTEQGSTTNPTHQQTSKIVTVEYSPGPPNRTHRPTNEGIMLKRSVNATDQTTFDVVSQKKLAKKSTDQRASTPPKNSNNVQQSTQTHEPVLGHLNQQPRVQIIKKRKS